MDIEMFCETLIRNFCELQILVENYLSPGGLWGALGVCICS